MSRQARSYAATLHLAWAIIAPLAHGQQTPAVDSDVSEAVRTYLTTGSGDACAEALKKVEGAFGSDVSALAACWRTLPLWKVLDSGDRAVSFDVGSPSPIECVESIPSDYDSAKPNRLIIVLPGESESPAIAVADVRRLVQSAQRSAVIVAPLHPIQATFSCAPDEALIVETLLREMRRRYHVDESGVRLWGRGAGGDAAWQWAFFHPDRFAGLIVQDGLADVPYPEQLVATLMSNLRGCSVLVSFNPAPPDARPLPGASPNLADAAAARAVAVATFNQSLCDWARSSTFSVTRSPPSVSGDPSEAPSAALVDPRPDELRTLLDARRTMPRQLDYRFRYPTQGSCDWLRQVRFLGPVWELPEISILPAATADRDTVILDTLKRKLGRLSGRVDARAIDLTVEHCDRVEVRFFDGMVDLSKPIRLTCNGKTRFNGLVRPSVATALEFARQEWCFECALAARLAFNIDSTAAAQ